MRAAKKNPWLKRKPMPRAEFTVPKPGQAKKDPPKMIVQGQQVDSEAEWYVAQALEILDLDFDYQHPVEGGRSLRGGQVLDFLVYTPGRWTIVDPRGSYWHTGQREDLIEVQTVARERRWNLVLLKSEEIPNTEAAVTLLRAKLPHG